jgi:hypothetical protein
MAKVKRTYTLSPGIEEVLRKMSTEDLRSLSGQLEYLITEEHKRRQQTNTLVDPSTDYTILPARLSKTGIAQSNRGKVAPEGDSDE